MRASKVRAALVEARRFMAAAEDLLARHETDARQEHSTYPFDGSKASGATRRASLDLTRALAEMRRPGA